MEDQNEWSSWARIQRAIANREAESDRVEFKSAQVLEQGDCAEKLSKEVVAFANAAGGAVVIGIKESKSRAEKLTPLPEKWDHERVEDILRTSIQPKIDGLYALTVDGDVPGERVIVVNVPMSDTAHQSKDFRYYKRRGHASDPMRDNEIRDVMNRVRHPRIEPSLKLADGSDLVLELRNTGGNVAHYVVAEVVGEYSYKGGRTTQISTTIENRAQGEFLPIPVGATRTFDVIAMTPVQRPGEFEAFVNVRVYCDNADTFETELELHGHAT